MKVMKRYCDFDYDNNTIILFDATDSEPFDDLNITWISSGSVTEKANSKSGIKHNRTPSEKAQLKKEKMVPLHEYIEDQYRKKVQMEKERLLKKYRRKQQQRDAAVYSLQAQVAVAHTPTHSRSARVGATAFIAAHYGKHRPKQTNSMNAVQIANYHKMMLRNVNMHQNHLNVNMKYMNGANPRVFSAAPNQLECDRLSFLF